MPEMVLGGLSTAGDMDGPGGPVFFVLFFWGGGGGGGGGLSWQKWTPQNWFPPEIIFL